MKKMLKSIPEIWKLGVTIVALITATVSTTLIIHDWFTNVTSAGKEFPAFRDSQLLFNKNLQRSNDSLKLVLKEMKDTTNSPFVTKWKWSDGQKSDLSNMQDLYEYKMPYAAYGKKGIDF